MYLDQKVYLGKAGDEKISILPKMANRHGLIAGATGTGKTVTLKVMAESFSEAGVPVFLADVKGDLSGMVLPGTEGTRVKESLDTMGLREDGFAFKGFPTEYWDVYAENGLPLRTTMTEMGPLLLSRILQLNETQEGVLNIVYRIADDEGYLLIDTKDMRSMLQYVSENSAEYTTKYGNIAKQSIGAIQRKLLQLETDGGDLFFGEPALDVQDWIKLDPSTGYGMINVLDCQKLALHPIMYSTYLLWMLSELYELLPEVGDMEKPKLVFFFDEAHLLFDSATKNLKDKIAQVVKLIRSKGVGIYFITQNPSDVPGEILAQLGNKVQHALRAYTPAEQKGLKTAADSFRANPELDTIDALQNLGIGEALVSVLDEQGIPTIVKKTKILPPESQMGIVDQAVRTAKITGSALSSKYSESVDRDSAYEFLERKSAEAEAEKLRLAQAAAAAKEQAAKEKAEAAQRAKEEAAAKKEAEREAKRQAAEEEKRYQKMIKDQEKEEEAKKKARRSSVESVASSTAGTIGREIGKSFGSKFGSTGKTIGGNLGSSIARGIMKTIFKS